MNRIAAAVAAFVFMVSLVDVARGDVFAIGLLGFPIAGGIIVYRRPSSTIGWLLVGIGASPATRFIAGIMDEGPSALDVLARIVDKAGLATSPLIPFLVLLFPTGHLPSPRWRIPARASGAAISLLILMEIVRTDSGTNPIGIPAADGFVRAVYPAFVTALVLFGLAALVNAFIRLRRADGDERRQLKWFAFSVAIFPLLFLTAVSIPESEIQGILLVGAFGVGFNAIAVGIGVAIMKYHLYDIDLVINKAVVFALLTGFITLVYAVVVVGIGSVVGANDRSNLALSLVATTLVALAFNPVRERFRRFANRAVYGERLSPYEAVSAFARRMAESIASEDVLPRMAEAAARGVGAGRSRVRLRLDSGADLVAYWPDEVKTADYHLTVPIDHQGETLGDIAIAKHRGESASHSDERLLSDLASQAGLAMKNLRLAEILRRQLVDLQESRRRIVSAQDEERVRMERDLHDGAQQQLVSLSVKTGLVENLLERDPEQAKIFLQEVKQETREALETLRDLARGLYPPVLRDNGLAAALETHVAKTGLDAGVEADGIASARFPREIETPVYFCIREALQNAAKYAEAARIVVRLEADDHGLRFSVSDDGPGFDPALVIRGAGLQNMIDRIEALGGSLTFDSAPGRGARVLGEVPLPAAS